jgi:hypothetical protein
VVLSDISTNRDKAYFLTMAANASPTARTFADWFRREVSVEAEGDQPVT